MKNKNCPAYNANTETLRTEIGSAAGKPIFSEKEVIVSEYCSVYNKYNDFDCENCKLKFNNKP